MSLSYRLLKYLTITVGASMVPWGTFTGFMLGRERYAIALMALVAQTGLAFGQASLWWWTFERQKKGEEK